MTSTLSPGDADQNQGKIRKHQVGIYGWRKRCLYGFILFIFAVLILNIALTVWIIRVMDFSLSGIGELQLIGRSVRINGEAEFLDSLYASSIKTRNKEDLLLESSNDVIIHARDHLHRVVNEIKIGNGKLESVCEDFIIRDKSGKIRFGVNKDGITLGSDQLKVAGLVVEETVQTPLVRGPSSEPLRLLSLTRDVKVVGPEGVQIRAPAGKIHMSSLDDITVTSKGKGIRLDSEKIFLKNLPLSNSPGIADQSPDMYQLCVCKENGRLFIDLPAGKCEPSATLCS